ncbi:TPA: hypothetical protein N0F65_012953, partial [Lagenidium giganteum]
GVARAQGFWANQSLIGLSSSEGECNGSSWTKRRSNGWSVRTDVTVPGNLTPVWGIKNANLNGFAPFMEDRSAAELLKAKFALYFGKVTDDAKPGVLGTAPRQDISSFVGPHESMR